MFRRQDRKRHDLTPVPEPVKPYPAPMMSSPEVIDTISQPKDVRLIRFLEELAQLRSRPVTDLMNYEDRLVFTMAFKDCASTLGIASAAFLRARAVLFS